MPTRFVAGLIFSVVFFSVAGVVGVVDGSAIVRAAEPTPPAKKPVVPSPLPAREALRHFVLHPALKMELVACEPQVIDPVAMAFDENGRLWVVEMRDYPNGPPAGKPPLSRIKWLEDRNGDGFYETAHTFAEKLLFANGLQPWRGGVIVTLSGQVAYLKDTDGDGRADVRETWFIGFAERNPQLRANHPTFALDNHIYVANGLRGGTVMAAKKEWTADARPVSLSGRDFRFDPLTGKYEAVTGMGQFGLTFDDFGNRFLCSNRNPCRHVVLENRYLARNPFLAVREVLHDVSPAGEKSRVFPLSRAWTTSTLHAGQFTAACGVTIYRGDLLPDEFRGNSFTCEPTGNLVHRDVLRPLGATFTSRPGRKGVEFLATADEWFRPVNLAHGPDGALYVVDMYRAVIEHPQFMPAELKNRPDLRRGERHGRIYRIVPAGKKRNQRTSHSVKLAALSTGELLQRLDHPNRWQRMTAARLIFQRQDRTVVNELEKLAADAHRPVRTRIQALWALRGLKALRPELAAGLLREPGLSPALSAQLLRLIEPFLQEAEQRRRLLAGKESIEQLFNSAESNDDRLRFQAALSLGELPESERRQQWYVQKLAGILLHPRCDAWTRTAVLSSSSFSPGRLLQTVLQQIRRARSWSAAGRSEAVEQTAELTGSREDNLTGALAVLLAEESQQAELRVCMAGILGLERGARRRRGKFSAAVRKLPAKSRKRWDAMFAAAAATVGSSQSSLDEKKMAVRFITLFEYDRSGPVLESLLQKSTAPELQAAAVNALSRYRHRGMAAVLLRGFRSRSPRMKRAVLDALLADPLRTRALLDAIAEGKVSIRELNPLQVRRLLSQRDAALRKRATQLLAAAIPADRQKVLAQYRRALTLKADARRGKAVFQKNCTTCHRIGSLGVNVAPDIADSRTKTPEQLLVSILDPNRAIDNNYISYTAVTTEGKVVTGIIVTETASSVTLKQAENKSVTLLRRDIEVLRSNGISLMPVGLEKNITVQQMADLIAFIKNWRYLDGRVPVAPASSPK